MQEGFSGLGDRMGYLLGQTLAIWEDDESEGIELWFTHGYT